MEAGVPSSAALAPGVPPSSGYLEVHDVRSVGVPCYAHCKCVQFIAKCTGACTSCHHEIELVSCCPQYAPLTMRSLRPTLPRSGNATRYNMILECSMR